MLSYRRYSAPSNYTIPIAGSKVLVFGDSISDNLYAHWAEKLFARYGWIQVGQNLITNSNFEVDATGWGDTFAGTIARSTAHVFIGSGALAQTATASGTVYCGPQAAASGMTNGMVAGFPYTFSAYVWYAGAGTAFPIFYESADNVTFPNTVGASISPSASWQRITVSRTLATTAITAFCRVQRTGGTAGEVWWIDAAQINRGTAVAVWNDSQATSNPMARAAVSGTNLQSNDATASNGTTFFSSRVAAYGPLDMVIVAYGMNDLYYIGGSPTPTTLARWSTAVSTCLANIQAMAGPPKIIWLGINNSQDALTLPAWAISQDDAVRQMDAITAPLVTAAGGIFIPMRPQMDNRLVDVGGGQPRHPTKPEGENFMYERIVRFLEMGM